MKAKLRPKMNLARGICAASLAALAAVGCSKGSSSSSSSTGTLSVSGSLTVLSASGLADKVQSFQNSFSVSGTEVSVDCGAAGTFTGSVDSSTGAFSASGVPAGVPCSFNFVSASSGTIKCEVQFQDSSSYDLNNNPMSTSTATATSNVVLGSITCDTSGNITIPSSSVSSINSSATVDANAAFDFTGEWSAAAYDGTLPEGVSTITTCTSNCHGPGVGQPISLVRFHGQAFTPNGGQCTPATNVTCAVTDGTVDATKDGYGMSIWGGDYAHGIGACGAKTGFTADEARAFAHLSLDTTPPSLAGHALSYGHYVWSTPTGFGQDTGWNQPWMYTGATSNWNIQDCQPVSIPQYPANGASDKAGWACYAQNVTSGTPNGVYVWNVGMQNSGGCVDSNNKPIMVSNWANLTGSCTSTASTFNSHMVTNSCTYTGSPNSGDPSITFTCGFTGGPFKDISGSTGSTDNNGPDFGAPYTMPANTWQGQPATIIASGDPCAGSSSEATLLAAAGSSTHDATQKKAAKELLMRYQCYANQYWQHSSNGAASTSCSRSYNFNWQTNNFAEFVTGDDRSMKPQNAFITDRVFYSPDGQWAFLKNVETRYESVPTASGSTLCPMKSTTELKFKHVTDNKLMVNFTQSTVMADTSATCQGAVLAALAGGGTLSPDPQGLNNLYQELQTQRLIFYMTK